MNNRHRQVAKWKHIYVCKQLKRMEERWRQTSEYIEKCNMAFRKLGKAFYGCTEKLRELGVYVAEE